MDGKISRNHFLVRTAYMWKHPTAVPRYVGLCSLIWRAFFFSLTFALMMAAAVAMIGIIVVGLAMGAYEAIIHLTLGDVIFGGEVLGGTIIGIVVLALVIAAVATCMHYLDAEKASEAMRPLQEYLRAKKEKICPIYIVV